MDPRVVFDHTIEGLVRAIGTRMTPRTEERLLAAGYLRTGKKTGYPYAQWADLVRIAREELFPQLPDEQAYRQVGARFVEAYFDSFMGKAVGTLAKLLGPKRTLARATQNFRSGNNFTETKLTELSPNHFEFWINAVEHPGFTAGVLTAGLQISGAKDVQVAITRNEGEAWFFQVTWA